MDTMLGRKGVPIHLFTEGVPVEHEAMQQLYNVASLPIVGPAVAVMPDVHWGMGATVGSVIPTNAAIIPAAVGVDIGCGMMAVKTDVEISELDGKMRALRDAIENAVPVGGPGEKGSWKDVSILVSNDWHEYLDDGYRHLKLIAPDATTKHHPSRQLGTLGTGNHFIEVCVDTTGAVWMMLHSGSRGIGNRIGTYFTERAKLRAQEIGLDLPDRDLAWLDEGEPVFQQYVFALGWAQQFARRNRERMMYTTHMALESVVKRFVLTRGEVVNCHHNYVEFQDGGRYLTRKGAVSAKLGELGIIPGSMGAKSFIVRGKGNPDSFESCSHGAGRAMSRGKAKRTFTVEQHEHATAGVECRKDAGVLDETPGAYKDIDAVMDAQKDLVSIVATLKQVVCVKG
jgi:tRNA-splicing ligase RtcB